MKFFVICHSYKEELHCEIKHFTHMWLSDILGEVWQWPGCTPGWLQQGLCLQGSPGVQGVWLFLVNISWSCRLSSYWACQLCANYQSGALSWSRFVILWGFGCLELCIYGIRELVSATSPALTRSQTWCSSLIIIFVLNINTILFPQWLQKKERPSSCHRPSKTRNSNWISPNMWEIMSVPMAMQTWPVRSSPTGWTRSST